MDAKVSRIFSKEDKMSAQAEAQVIVEGMIASFPNGTPFKVSGPTIARRLGVSVRRVRAFLYGEARVVGADELARLRHVALARNPISAEELHARRLEAIAAALEAADPEFHRESAALHRDMAVRLRGLASDRGMAGSGAQ